MNKVVSRLVVVAALVVGWAALFLAPAAPASAHAVLESTSPAANSIVPAAPPEVVLTFSEGVRQVPDKIHVVAPDGSRADTGQPIFADSSVTIPLKSGGANGTYLVNYRVISADSHPVAGAFTYSVGAPSAAPPTDTDAPAVEESTFLKIAFPVVKYLGYAGLVLLIGPALVLALLWPQRLSREAPSRLAWLGVGLIALSTLGDLFLQAPYTTGGGYFDGAALRDVLGSTFGTAHLIRLGVLAASAFLLRPLLSGRSGVADRALLVILGVVGLATWPLSGHSGASPVPAVSVVVDIAHIAGMAVWLGGLVMLVAFVFRQASPRELGVILPVWSRWAALAVTALFLAGVVQALIEVGTIKPLFTTAYGQLIIAKVVLFAVVLGVAALSRNVVRRRTAPDDPRPLRRLVLAEVMGIAVVLALSSVLVQTTPARTAAANATVGEQQPAYYSTMITTDSKLNLQVEVDPAKQGNNDIHLYAYTKDNQPQVVVEWKGTASLPSGGIEAIDIPLLGLAPTHASGAIQLPRPGQWELKFVVRISEIDQATVTATVPVQ
ncbi:copper resistance protein CopC [Asanoa sp. WMMD1127]|uniref:copper resistance CopC/CopD family protein n=1 Tax=Asanoa sp. WMMD1127 TaxID=3016107 RepID=UPI00241808E8|nr:copper resistance protein CopC [Asanoa sp. WMMD1127]MDG4820560.1 copper resistance protein CopC [Asanoa sp. WMMD1127]